MGNNKDVFSIRKVSFGVGSIIIGGLCFVTINDNAYASESRNAPEQVTVTDSSKAPDQDTISEPRRASEPATVFEPTLVLDQADETHHKMASPQKMHSLKQIKFKILMSLIHLMIIIRLY